MKTRIFSFDESILRVGGIEPGFQKRAQKQLRANFPIASGENAPTMRHERGQGRSEHQQQGQRHQRFDKRKPGAPSVAISRS
jgi:hypothetical protein